MFLYVVIVMCHMSGWFLFVKGAIHNVKRAKYSVPVFNSPALDLHLPFQKASDDCLSDIFIKVLIFITR